MCKSFEKLFLHNQRFIENQSKVMIHMESLTESLVSNNNEKPFIDNLSEILKIPVALITCDQKVIRSKQTPNLITWPNHVDFAEKEKIFIPIEKENRTVAYLICWLDVHPLPSVLKFVLNQAIQLLKVHLTTRKKEDDKKVEEFMEKWILGEFLEEARIRRNAAIYGVSLKNKYILCLVSPKNLLIKKHVYIQLQDDWLQKEILLFYIKNQLIYLVPEEAVCHNPSCYIDFLEDIKKRTSVQALRLGISRPKTVDCINEGLYEAQEALRKCFILKNDHPLCYFEQLTLFRIFDKISNDEELKSSLLNSIKPIIDYDQNKGTQLFDTLYKYFEYNCNAKKTAESLFCHYNSVIYRLERIEQLLHFKLSHSKNNFEIQLATQWYEYQRKMTGN